MSKTEVKIRPVDLPHGPRQTMAVLRRHGRYALLESALVMPGQAEWSYIAGPAGPTLYTDDEGTRLERGGEVLRRFAHPLEAVRAMADAGEVVVDGERPAGLNFIGGWVGAFGYDLARSMERLPRLTARDPALPAMWWMSVDQVLAFHHPSGRWWHCTMRGPGDPNATDAQKAWACTLELARAEAPPERPWSAGASVQRMGRARFESGVQSIRESIADGEVLQVNLTRREDAPFEGDAWSLYADLMRVHPAPFAAFIEAPGFALASCSPERFLHLLGDEVEARPIKGTIGRGANALEDESRRQWLANSEKNRAENLMIVDLMRNDLGRVARLGSVTVPELFALEPYASVWQMVSTVRARLRENLGPADLIKACWPPGSMTGAPKLKAMEVIERLEPLQRGFYAGSIGYIDCTGNMDLSVVIRTAVVADGRVMLQLGGGIVADSEPAAEWAETVAKGERLTAVLSARSSPAGRCSSP